MCADSHLISRQCTLLSCKYWNDFVCSQFLSNLPNGGIVQSDPVVVVLRCCGATDFTQAIVRHDHTPELRKNKDINTSTQLISTQLINTIVCQSLAQNFFSPCIIIMQRTTFQ